jgi:hypothetical protein
LLKKYGDEVFFPAVRGGRRQAGENRMMELLTDFF